MIVSKKNLNNHSSLAITRYYHRGMKGMKIAIIGSSISGIAAAGELHEKGHSITIYEASKNRGGHVRTLWLSNGKETQSPHELGVFMLDPIAIHPTIASIAKALHHPINEFPLTFTFEYDKEGINWTTNYNLPLPVRNFIIFASNFFQNFGKKNLIRNSKYLLSIKQFLEIVDEFSEHQEYHTLSLKEFIEKYSIPPEIVEYWLLPQLLCWWGIKREAALSSSALVLTDSMSKVNNHPQYVFANGWTQFVESLIAPFKDHILTESKVDKISRVENGVNILCKGEEAFYDEVIIATPPSVALQLLSNPSREEKEILSSFTTCETEVYLHTNASYIPKKSRPAVVNHMKDDKGIYCTLWSGAYLSDNSHYFASWGEDDWIPPKQEDTIAREKWLRTLPTIEYVKACRAIDTIQGCANTWYAGAHVHALDTPFSKATPSLWHENAFLSGKYVAERLCNTNNEALQ